MGLYALLKGKAGASAARMLINATSGPSSRIFIWHSLHARVRGQLVRAGLSGVSRSRRVAAILVAMGPARTDCRFLPALGSAAAILMFALLIVRPIPWCFTGIAATPPCAAWRRLALSCRGDRKRFARASARLACWRRITHDGLLAFICEGRLRGGADAAHPLRQHARAGPGCCRQAALCYEVRPWRPAVLNKFFAGWKE